VVTSLSSSSSSNLERLGTAVGGEESDEVSSSESSSVLGERIARQLKLKESQEE